MLPGAVPVPFRVVGVGSPAFALLLALVPPLAQEAAFMLGKGGSFLTQASLAEVQLTQCHPGSVTVRLSKGCPVSVLTLHFVR